MWQSLRCVGMADASNTLRQSSASCGNRQAHVASKTEFTAATRRCNPPATFQCPNAFFRCHDNARAGHCRTVAARAVLMSASAAKSSTLLFSGKACLAGKAFFPLADRALCSGQRPRCARPAWRRARASRRTREWQGASRSCTTILRCARWA